MPWTVTPPLYHVWRDMLGRCYNSKSKQYKDYGGRGITVCDEWKTDFKQWLTDMGPKPTPQHTLDRIDNDKGYSKENCKWSTRKEQQRNQRKTIKVIIEGVEYKASELAEKYGIKTDTIVERATQGMSFKAVTTPGHMLWNESNRTNKCKNGHEYTPENTRIFPNGKRACRMCQRINTQKRYWEARARGVSSSDL